MTVRTDLAIGLFGISEFIQRHRMPDNSNREQLASLILGVYRRIGKQTLGTMSAAEQAKLDSAVEAIIAGLMSVREAPALVN